MASRIEDYALIGDMLSAALVSTSGSIDWLCWPRFDSAACFAALLGTADHGRWLLTPATRPSRVTRRYLGETLILETTFENEHGVVSITDFMPPRGEAPDVVRIVRGVKGEVPMRMDLTIRFDYGSTMPWVTQTRGGNTELHAVAGPDMLTLRTSVPVRGEGPHTVADFSLRAGDAVAFVLTYSPSHEPAPKPVDVTRAYKDTEECWNSWSAKCTFPGPWREAVMRSLIALRALIYAPTGGIVAAVTTSLPERIGGQRNWDYRYCWLRDATFTLLSLMNAGYYDEAARWREWLVRALAGSPAQAQTVYGVGGERRLAEWEVPWLPGFEQSRPVRVGNSAALQRQLDIYGEVLDAFHHARRGGLAAAQVGWDVQRALIEHVTRVWTEPDEGIWEVRGPCQHFTHSKVMAWVALDRAVQAIESYGLPGELGRWRELRARVHAEVCEHGFNPRIGSFVQAYGSHELDASSLLIPLVGFLPPTDARIRGTVEAIGKHLMRDGLMQRYESGATNDGLPPGEGTFLACSFWYVDNLALVGRHDEACERFEHLLSLRNDVGLLAEQYDPRAHRQLGNFPQAFSHVALLGSAYNLTDRANQ